jgi:hypothetical protein
VYESPLLGSLTWLFQHLLFYSDYEDKTATVHNGENTGQLYTMKKKMDNLLQVAARVGSIRQVVL